MPGLKLIHVSKRGSIRLADYVMVDNDLLVVRSKQKQLAILSRCIESGHGYLWSDPSMLPNEDHLLLGVTLKLLMSFWTLDIHRCACATWLTSVVALYFEAERRTAVTTLLTHWSHCSLAWSHRIQQSKYFSRFRQPSSMTSLDV